LVKLPAAKPAKRACCPAPPDYTELWNKEVQQRLDNYWEIYKPDLLANKDHVPKLFRLAYVEALRNLIATMRNELGEGASNTSKKTASTGSSNFAEYRSAHINCLFKP